MMQVGLCEGEGQGTYIELVKVADAGAPRKGAAGLSSLRWGVGWSTMQVVVWSGWGCLQALVCLSAWSL
jgi:hypothetical protein